MLLSFKLFLLLTAYELFTNVCSVDCKVIHMQRDVLGNEERIEPFHSQFKSKQRIKRSLPLRNFGIWRGFAVEEIIDKNLYRTMLNVSKRGNDLFFSNYTQIGVELFGPTLYTIDLSENPRGSTPFQPKYNENASITSFGQACSAKCTELERLCYGFAFSFLENKTNSCILLKNEGLYVFDPMCTDELDYGEDEKDIILRAPRGDPLYLIYQKKSYVCKNSSEFFGYSHIGEGYFPIQNFGCQPYLYEHSLSEHNLTHYNERDICAQDYGSVVAPNNGCPETSTCTFSNNFNGDSYCVVI